MRPARLAALQPCRISASRALMDRAIRGRWRITRRHFDIDEKAKGHALYRIETPTAGRSISRSSPSSSRPVGRTGRIIGRSWDMMAALVEGPMSEADIETHAARNCRSSMPAARRPARLIWCRSNRSSRAFNHARRSPRRRPPARRGVVGQVCYLMRNTGLDGNGTFGTRSFRALEADHPLRTSLSAQMLCAYMMRVFAHDLVDHLARCRLAPRRAAGARDRARSSASATARRSAWFSSSTIIRA